MDADFKLVKRIFGRSTAKFEVPAYQRGYEWSNNEFNDLWLDIQRIEGRADKHFLGNIILLKKEGQYSDEYEIVDGQQRLATISILVMAIRDSKDFQNEDDSRIRDILYRSKDGKENRRFLHLYNDSADNSYESLWCGSPEKAEGNIKDAYVYYQQKLSQLNGDEIEDVLSKVFNNLSVVETTVDDPALAYPIFQTQNARGKEVSPIVLVKSRIHGAARKLGNKRDEQHVIDQWEEIYEDLREKLGGPRFRSENIRVRRPMSHILSNSPVETETRVKSSSLYETFERVLNNFDDVRDFVDWFEEEVKNHLYNLSSSRLDVDSRKFNKEIDRQLQYLNASSNHSEVLSMAIYKKYENEFDIWDQRKKELLKHDFRLAAILGVRMRLASIDRNDIRDFTYSAASKIKEATGHTDIRKTLQSVIDTRGPTDPEIVENLRANKVSVGGRYQFRTVLYLVSIEESRRNDIFRMNLNRLDVEHITPKKTFEKPRYVTWRKHHSEENFGERKDKIGNLTLLTPEDHSGIDEENGFESKKQSYQNSSIKTTQELCDYKKWNDEEIDERSARMGEQLANYWSIK